MKIAAYFGLIVCALLFGASFSIGDYIAVTASLVLVAGFILVIKISNYGNRSQKN